VGAHDKATIFLVKCTRPDHTDDVMAEIKELLPTNKVQPVKEYMSLMTSTNIPALQTFIHSMIALAVSIGLLVIFLSMYTTVLERTRDIGVLKSLGASKGLIVRTLLAETTLLCLLGIFAGIGMSYAVRAGFLKTFPTLSILITPEWIVRAGLIALAGSLVGASYPAWQASRKDAVEALAYD
jgi:putative ABC transport system permease protein